MAAQAILTFATPPTNGLQPREVTVTLPTSGAIGGHIKIAREGQAPVDQDLTQTVQAQVGLTPQ